MADFYSVRCWNRAIGDPTGGLISLLAGGPGGLGGTHSQVTALACTSDGAMLYACDKSHHQIRSINVNTRGLTVVAKDARGRTNGLNDPSFVALDRAPTAKPDAALFVTCKDSIMRLNLQTGFSRAARSLPSAVSRARAVSIR